jgi:hypothetical protein
MTPMKSLAGRTPARTVVGVLCGVVAAVACSATAPPAHAQVGFGIEANPGIDAIPGEHLVWAGTCELGTAPAAGEPIAGGFGTRPTTVTWWSGFLGASGNAAEGAPHCVDPGQRALYGVPVFTTMPQWRQPPETQAGSHPDSTLSMVFARDPSTGAGGPTPGRLPADTDNIVVSLPPGFVGNPASLPKCTQEQFRENNTQCPPKTQVGIVTLNLKSDIDAGHPWEETAPVYNLEPRPGRTAELGIPDIVSYTAARVTAKARTNGDFGVTAFTGQIPATLPLYSQTITLWGVPWAAEHDAWRPRQYVGGSAGVSAGRHIPANGVPATNRASYDPSWGAIRPFISNLTECDGQEQAVGVLIDAYQKPGTLTAEGDPDLSDLDWLRYTATAPAVSRCDTPPFQPTASFRPTTTAADSPSGLDVDITIPQNNEPPVAVANNPDDATGAPAHWRSDQGRATAHLDKTVVRLPQGMTVNPSGATGLAGCTDAQMGVTAVANPYRFDNTEPSCPEGSKIGLVEATTPLLTEKLTGEVVLGVPKSIDPQSGEMLRLFLVLRNDERALLAKIYGSAVADPGTGQLTATFDKNPRVPVENIKVWFKGGDRGVLATPQRCGTAVTASQFTPWTAAHGGGGLVRDLIDQFDVSSNCGFGFGPSLNAGMSTQQAKAPGTFSFAFARQDGEQWLSGLTADLPTGLLASVKDVPLCTDAQASAGACPAGSRIGTVDAAAGSGTPFVLEEKGEVFLTEGYKGGAYGLMVKVRAIAGPFRGDMELSPIVVRQAIHVDRDDASVTAVSDPFPLIHHGIPLRVRSITVNVDRPGFMVNPSDCSPKQIAADLLSAEGASARAVTPFQVARCGELPLRPRLSLRLTGRKQVKDGKHPGLRAVLTQGPGEANLRSVVTRLPLSLALDPERAQSDDMCEFEDGRRAECPARSIIGRARAFSPLLNRPLEGPVYFVKNVRVHPRTGYQIRTLPTLLLKLSGEIALNVRATTSVERGKLVTTFPAIPDAAVERFELNLEGGRDGILAVTNTNLCRRPSGHSTEVDFDGQNGRRHDRNVRMTTPCPKKKKEVPARLRVRAASFAGDRLRVSGTIAAAAGRDVRVGATCGSSRGTTRISARARPRRGRWNATLTLRGRCVGASRALVVARYAGERKLKAATNTRVLHIGA